MYGAGGDPFNGEANDVALRAEPVRNVCKRR